MRRRPLVAENVQFAAGRGVGRPDRGGCYTVSMRRPTIRGTAKWGLTGAAVVLAVLWAIIRGRFSGVVFPAFPVIPEGMPHDGLFLGSPPDANMDAALSVWLPMLRRVGSRMVMHVPLWIPLAMTALPAGFLWRADRQRRALLKRGGCPNCHYDRTGLAAGAPCPECGRAPTKATP
jgi:hypothetical protein